jgi:Zn-dependent peptidase ImmA (M78 family)/transcriptional regulator with XRE-family HTH domain
MTNDIGERARARIAVVATGIPQLQIAAAVGMTPDAFSRALGGSRGFSAAELARLAEYLRTSMHWLVTGEPDPFTIAVAARHEYDHVAGMHRAVVVLRDVALSYQQVHARLAAPRENPTEPWTAAGARAALELASGPGFVRTFAEAIELTFGIDVVRIGGVPRGYSLMSMGHKAIVVGETGNWFFQNWSMAHELGHLLIGDMTDLSGAERNAARDEVAANAFAAELLLPEAKMRRRSWDSIELPEVARILWEAGVSTATLRARLLTLSPSLPERLRPWLDQTTQKVLRQFWQPTNQTLVDEITERMEGAATRRFPASLIAAHYEAVSAGQLHAGTLAWMLGVDETELEAELAPHDNSTPDVDWLASQLGLTDTSSR